MGRGIFDGLLLVTILDAGDRILILVTSFGCFVSNIRHHYRCSHFWLLTLWYNFEKLPRIMICVMYLVSLDASPSILRGLSKWYLCEKMCNRSHFQPRFFELLQRISKVPSIGNKRGSFRYRYQYKFAPNLHKNLSRRQVQFKSTRGSMQVTSILSKYEPIAKRLRTSRSA